MVDHGYLISALLLMAVATQLTRFLPFLVLGRFKDNPHLRYVGHYLPPAVMFLLVTYCLKDVPIQVDPFYGLREGISVLVVAVVHLSKRNALLSIAAGTALYIFLLRI